MTSENFEQRIVDELVDALAETDHEVSKDDFQVVDARAITSGSDLSSRLPTPGSAALLLTGYTRECSDLLFDEIGIRSREVPPYLLVRALGVLRGRTVYHLVSGCRELEGEGKAFEIRGEAPEGSEPPAEAGEASEAHPQARRISPERVFAEAVARTWHLSADDLATAAEDDGPIQHQWLHTEPYSFTPWGEESKGYTPPDDQTLSASVTFTMNAYLDQAESGDFQWLYVESLGYQSTGGGMAKDDHDHRGWGNAFVEVQMKMPSSAAFYSSSPPNTNDSKTVTTSVSFDVGYGTASAGIDKSQTETLTDWKVTLQDLDQWVYEQHSPFDGSKTFDEFPDGAVDYDAGKARHEIEGWPTLTKTVFDWSTMSVSRLDPATSETVTVSFYLGLNAMFFRIKNEWPSWEGTCWPYGVGALPSYDLDMSKVTA